MQDQDVIAEFLAESAENLARLDGEMVEIERHPEDAERLASVFRTMHTVKGTCGFLGFSAMEGVSHHCEAILSQIRSGLRRWNAELVGLVFESADALRRELASVEKTQAESGKRYDDLIGRLAAAAAEPEESHHAAAPPPAPAKPASASAPELPAEETVRVAVGVLDRLMNLVGELVLARNQLLPYWQEAEDPQLQTRAKRLSTITASLQESMMRTRMQRMGAVWGRMPRMVRDIARGLGKEIDVVLEGTETELDRTLVELIKDPLTHLVRNACDHGLETPVARQRAGKAARGTLVLRAYHRGGNVFIEIADDGAGIDPARVRTSAIEKGLVSAEGAGRMSAAELQALIFRPGFSTAGAVTHLSGRGVGMDVVKTNVERIGGAVELDSAVGRGTTVRLRIPLTLAILPGLTVRAGGERFVIPQTNVGELIRIEGEAVAEQVRWIHDAPVLKRRGRLLPLTVLAEDLGLGGPGRRRLAGAECLEVVVLLTESRRFGLVVEAIEDSEEIVVKALAPMLRALAVYAGTSILGDGSVALILDANGLAERTGLEAEGGEEDREREEGERPRLLVCELGGGKRLAVPVGAVARLERIGRERLERAAGGWWAQYGGGLLPVFAAAGAAWEPPEGEMVMIVLEERGRRAGVLVEEILEVAEAEGELRRERTAPGVAGAAVVAGRVTEVLDPAYYVAREEGAV